MSQPQPVAPDRPLTLGSTSLILLCGVIWGGTVVAIRFSVDALPPVGTAGLRFTLAAVFMFVWCRWDRCPLRLERGQIAPVVQNDVRAHLAKRFIQAGAERVEADAGDGHLGAGDEQGRDQRAAYLS